MTRISSRLARAWAALLAELRMFLGYALIVFLPGATPPQHPQPAPEPKPVPANWQREEYQAYIDEARLDMERQQTDKRDIRARAQVVLTTALVVGGAIAASYADKTDLGTCGKWAYLLSAIFTTLAALAAGGIVTAKSAIGGPNLRALLYTETGGVHRRIADEYAATRHDGAATVAVLVTVLRDCVLALLLGAGTLAIAHAFS
jgi:hypothetical protein